VNPWKEFWEWFYENYFFHTVIVIAIFFIVFFPDRIHRFFGKLLKPIFSKYKKIKLGPVELQGDEEIDPNTPCPYKKSRDITFGVIRDVESKVNEVEKKVDNLAEVVQKAVAIIEDMSIDQQKQLFYDEDQPDEDRLAGGLKYLYRGGNGSTKPNVVAFIEEHKELYNGFIKAKPELRLQ